MRDIKQAGVRLPRLVAVGIAVCAVLATQPVMGTALAVGTCAVDNETSGQTYPASDGATLQQAIDEAHDGDRLFIGGRCFGGFAIDKSLTLIGGILDGGGSSTVVQVSYASVFLGAMLITNGFGDYGGGIINNGGVIDVWGTGITHSEATQSGGGVFNQGTLTLHEDASITRNSAGFSGGGGIYNYHGSVEMRRSSDVSHNTTDNVGGGIDNEGGSVLMFRNSRVRENRSGNSAGGIYNGGGRVKLSDSAGVVRNRAGLNGGGVTANGGGVLNEEGAILILDDASRVSNNDARSGGGVCNNGYLRPEMLIMKGQSRISGNVARDGGGVCNFDATMALQGEAIVTGNTATGDGGGIWDRDGKISMQDSSQVVSNVAEGGAPDAPAGVGGGIRRCATALRGVTDGVNVVNNIPDNIGKCP